jgi:hypothetical protein
MKYNKKIINSLFTVSQKLIKATLKICPTGNGVVFIVLLSEELMLISTILCAPNSNSLDFFYKIS